MEFSYGQQTLSNLRRAQEQCYLLTNRKGGYSSLSLAGSASRNEQVLLMASIKAPNEWVQMVANVEEILSTRKGEISFFSQEYVGYTKNKEGCKNLLGYRQNSFPTWTYLHEGVQLEKTILMDYETNGVLLCYEVENHKEEEVSLKLRPWFRFEKKGEMPRGSRPLRVTEETISCGDHLLYVDTDGLLEMEAPLYEGDWYFEDDAKDERSAIGAAFAEPVYRYQLKQGEKRKIHLYFGLVPMVGSREEFMAREVKRREDLLMQGTFHTAISKQLALAADAFVVDRASTGGRTIIAGYPFFGDWGRDTMIAVMGCCIATRRKEDTEEIFRSFMKYMRKGIMPNMFPEGEAPPMYNTVDASLLFIYAVYEYYKEFQDLSFVEEAYDSMAEIIRWYQKGTDFHIQMDEDGLMLAGRDLEQVTWMDIRIQGYLPTPRHGKPVEINAYWYNDLKIMAVFSRLLQKGEEDHYEALAKKVQKSFLEKFWHEKGYLRDVVSGTKADDQVRLNQIYAVSVPFGMLPKEKEKQVVRTVFEELYTPYGLRSLSPKDEEYRGVYGGSLWNRDMAYHQGTAWAFPLGAYYLAYLKVQDHSEEAKRTVKKALSLLEGTLREGCVGQVAEIFDGDGQGVSKGCFAQAWSVGELLRASLAAER